jgi:oligo-1,6-glucosidase
MNREVLQHYDIMTVAEGPGTSVENVLDFVDADRNELNMSYHFDHAYLGLLPRKVVAEEGWSLVDLKAIFTRWDKTLAEKGWGTIYFGNHDQPRMVSRWGNDAPECRELSSKMLTTFLLSMRGTPYYYQGDEIGMSNIKFDNIEDYRDIETINWYHLTKKEGGDLDEFLASHKITARDNGRTPIQWDNSANGGFTNATPWLKVNPNYEKVNVESQENDPNSVLNYFRKMVSLRKSEQILVYGKYTIIDENNPSIYAFIRESEEKTFLVLLNFTSETAKVDLGNLTLENAKILISNYLDPTISNELRPYEAIIIEI